MKAKKLPSGNWRCRAYDNTTKTTKSFTAPTKKEAEYLASEWLTGRKILAPRDRTLKKCIEDYIAMKESVLSVSSIDKYRKILKNQLSESILSIVISDIDILKLQQEINRLSVQYAPKTVHSAYGLISSVLKVYLPNQRYNVTLPKIQKRSRTLPSASEIFEAFRGSGEMELIVYLGMWLGLRQSEIRGLKKSDFRNGVLSIDRTIVTVDGKFIEQDTAKTVDSKRNIKVPDIIMGMVNAINGEYITSLSGHAIYQRFVRRMEKFGLKGVTFHDLRHINASVMLQLGIPDKYAMERGGWSTTSTLKRVYQETFSEKRNAVDMQIDSYFENEFQNVATKLATENSKCDNKAS